MLGYVQRSLLSQAGPLLSSICQGSQTLQAAQPGYSLNLTWPPEMSTSDSLILPQRGN